MIQLLLSRMGGFTTAVAVAALVVGGVVTSSFAMVLVRSALIYVAGGLCCFNSLVVVVNHYRISKLESLRDVINGLNLIIEDLGKEVDLLTDDVNTLQAEADHLNDIESQLGKIASEQGQTANDLMALVKENEAINNEKKSILRQDTMADICEIVLGADKNNDWVIDMKEVKMLTLQVKIQLEEHGVDLDQDKFIDMVREDSSIQKVLQKVAALMFKEDVYDKEPNGGDKGDSLMAGGASSARCHAEHNNEEDMNSMFKMNDKFHGGLAGSANLATSKKAKLRTKVVQIKQKAEGYLT